MGFNAGIVDMSSFNVSATLNIFRVLAKPSLCLPQATVASFAELPIPLDQAFAKYRSQGNDVNIKAVILDKDDCFAVPHENDVHKPYRVSHTCSCLNLHLLCRACAPLQVASPSGFILRSQALPPGITEILALI